MIKTTLGLSGVDCWMAIAEGAIRSNAAASVVMRRIVYLDEAFERYMREGRIQRPEDVDGRSLKERVRVSGRF
jgi:hypothetical protein